MQAGLALHFDKGIEINSNGLCTSLPPSLQLATSDSDTGKVKVWMR